MKLTKRRRENLAKFMFSLAQIIFATVIVGRFISPDKISLAVFIYGIFWFLIFDIFGYLINSGGEQ